MADRPTITTGLRDAVHRYNKYSSMTMPCESQTYVKCDADTFDRMCDAIDVVHKALENENERLRLELDALSPDTWESIVRDAYNAGRNGDVIVVETFEKRCRALAGEQ